MEQNLPPPSYNQYQIPNGYGYGAAPPPTMGYGAQPMGYGAQPMGYGVAPGYPMQPANYEQMMNYRNTLLRQRREYQEKLLRENYPVKYAIVHSGILIAFALTTIGIQIAMITLKTTMYYVGSGTRIVSCLTFFPDNLILCINIRRNMGGCLLFTPG